MNQIKLIFSDMDGTLLNNEGKLSQQTIDSVRRLRHKKIAFILTSARSPEGMADAARQLDLQTMPFISYNGGLIGRFQPDGHLDTLESTPLEPSDRRAIYSYVNARCPDVNLSAFVENTWYVRQIDARVAREAELSGCQPVMTDLGHLIGTCRLPFYKFMLMAPAETTDQLMHAFSAHAYPHTAVTRSHPTYLEVTHRQATKLHAVKKLADYLGVTQEAIAAFGDQYNDLDMLNYASVGIAVKNAPQTIQDAANILTESNENDGVALALNRYF
ncbi:MAG: Cof-type HAD-IIB family hydrolase [Sporolactobacillus sp.]